MTDAIARHVYDDSGVQHIPASAVAAGEVIALADGRPGVAISAISSGATGEVYTRGQFDVTCASALVLTVGTRVYWDVSGNTAILLGTGIAADDFYLGRVIKAKASGDTVVRVEIGADQDEAEFRGLLREVVADDLTLDAQDNGKVLLVTVDAKTITLPATSVGLRYVIANGGADGAVAVTISPNANDKIMGPNIAGVDNKDRINTKATAKTGDFIVIVGDGVDGWDITREVGTWAAEG